MELALGSKYLQAELTAGCDVAGQEHLLVVVKGSWSFAGGQVRPIPAQAIAYSDIFNGPQGESAPRYESDFALFKPRCDILFDAYAHAPEGQSVAQMLAGFALDNVRKILRVTGERSWQKGQDGKYLPSAPSPFAMLPLHYGYAYGGQCEMPDSELTECFLNNPVGIGFTLPDVEADGLDMASLQYPDEQDVSQPEQAMRAAALSPIARHWLPRRNFGGTYDAAWQRDVFPFLPEDFDMRFHQAAPEDQQCDYPQGGEEVLLFNLIRGQSEVRFKLPRLNKLPIRVLLENYRVEQMQSVVDTLYFETEAQRFSAVWRGKLPVKSLQDIKTVAIGGVCKQWWQAKTMGAENCAGCAKKHAPQAPPPSEEDCAQDQTETGT